MADFEESNGLGTEPTEPFTEEQQTEQTQPAEAEPEVPHAAPPQPPRYAAQPDGYGYGAEHRGAYADAGYVPTSDAGAMPRSYSFAPQTEHKAKKEKRARRGMHPAAIIAVCLVCAILGGLVGGYGTRLFAKEQPAAAVPTATERSTTDSTVLTVAGASENKSVTTNTVSSGSEMSASDIYYNRAIDQVVTIKVEISYSSYFGYETKASGTGSGFIISEDGYILTNYHVIESVEGYDGDMKVITYDGTEYPATIIGYDEDHDVALLKIEATGLHAAVLGDSDAMLVGENVYVVGNPTGELEYSMTEGIVSAKDREITASNSSTGRTETISVFQTTAAINGGNSGGPVYNTRGEVIGIVVAKRISTDIEGLAFAIPINDAVRIAQDLINDGYVRGKAYMGVSLGTVSAAAAQYYGLVQGAIVAGVVEGSSAEKAGLKESDIIVAIDGKEITSRDDLINAKKNYSAGDSAVLKVYRDSKYLELTITFDEETPDRLTTDSKSLSESSAEQQEPTDGKSAGEVPSERQQPTDGDYSDFFREFFGGSPFQR